jgi:hypothetical protein
MERPRLSGGAGRRRACFLLGGLGCGILLAAGCGPGNEPAAQHRRPAVEAEEARLERALETTKGDLEAHRARLSAGTTGQPADPKLLQETQALSRDLDRQLAELLNADPPLQGQPLTSRQTTALRIKGDQDVELARGWIERGGDYPRAINLYQEDLALDSGNSRLRSELVRVQGRRYMARAAFAQVQDGMDPETVRRLLGPPQPDNVRAYPALPGKGVAGWFYPRDANGGAAAVWFHREDGRLAVYRADFNAVPPPQPPTPPAP